MEFYNFAYYPGMRITPIEINGNLVNNGQINTSYDYFTDLLAKSTDSQRRWFLTHTYEYGPPIHGGVNFEVYGSVSGGGSWYADLGSILVHSTGPMQLGSIGANKGTLASFSSDGGIVATSFAGAGGLQLSSPGKIEYYGGPANVYLHGDEVVFGGALEFSGGLYGMITANRMSYSGPISADGLGTVIQANQITEGSVSSVIATNGGRVSVGMTIPLSFNSLSPIAATGSAVVSQDSVPDQVIGSTVGLYTTDTIHLTGRSLVVSGGSSTDYWGDRRGRISLGAGNMIIDGQSGDISNGAEADSAGSIDLYGTAPVGQASNLTVANTNFISPPLHSDGSQVTIRVSGFNNINLTNVTVDGGTMIDLPGITGPTYALGNDWSNYYTTVTGTLSVKNGASGTFSQLLLGTNGTEGDNTPTLQISIDSTSSLTLDNIQMDRVSWVLAGTLFISGTSLDDGDSEKFTGNGTINVLAGSILTSSDPGYFWGKDGHPGITLTGQGTFAWMYPINHGTILSPGSGILTVTAAPAGMAVAPPAPAEIATPVFHNYSDGVVHFQQGGGINFTGFSGGFDNEGLILYTSTIDWVTSGSALNDAGHIFSLNGYGTIRADGAGVVWGANPAVDHNSLVEQQHLEAINGAKIEVDGFFWNHDTLYVGAQDASGVGSKINLTNAGNSTIDSFNQATMGDPTGSITLSGRGSTTTAASLTLPDANLTASALGPTVAVSGFTTYNLAGTNGAVVNGGTMIDLGTVTGPTYTLEGGQSVNYTTLYGNLTLSNHATGTLHDLLIGNYTPGVPQASQPAATVISVDATSSLTVRNATLMNTLVVDNGTIYIDGTVNDGGYGATLSGHGIFSINAGATMTTQGSELGDHWNVFGMKDMTLTGQGTADHMYPVNYGTILSPTSGVLTIKALASGSWEPDATNPLAGSSQTFYNYADGVVHFQQGGGLYFSGFTDGFDNEGLILYTSTLDWVASGSALNDGNHIFSLHGYGTMRADGAGVVWGSNPGADRNSVIESQRMEAINGASITFNGFDLKNDLLTSTPALVTDTAGTLHGGTGAVLGTVGTASQDVSALSTFSHTTLTGASTVLQLSGAESIALDASDPNTPGLTVTGGAQLQLVGNGAHTVYGTTTTPTPQAQAATGSVGYGIGRITVDSGGSLLGAGNTTANQFGLTLGSGGSATISNPNLAHSAGTINLASAPVLPSSPFRFSAARAPGSGTGGTVAADSLPGATSAQTLTLLGDLQMAAASTLNVTIFGDSTNANSLLMAGSTGTSASTLNGTLAVTVASGVASLSATTLFVVFQENGAGYGSTRFGNAPATGSTITSADGNWIFGVNYVGNQVILGNATAVPEPSTYAILAGLAALGIASVRRWRTVIWARSTDRKEKW